MTTLKVFRNDLYKILIAVGTAEAVAYAEKIKEAGLWGTPTEDEIETAMELI